MCYEAGKFRIRDRLGSNPGQSLPLSFQGQGLCWAEPYSRAPSSIQDTASLWVLLPPVCLPPPWGSSSSWLSPASAAWSVGHLVRMLGSQGTRGDALKQSPDPIGLHRLAPPSRATTRADSSTAKPSSAAPSLVVPQDEQLLPVLACRFGGQPPPPAPAVTDHHHPHPRSLPCNVAPGSRQAQRRDRLEPERGGWPHTHNASSASAQRLPGPASPRTSSEFPDRAGQLASSSDLAVRPLE